MIRQGLFALLERFPERKSALSALYLESSSFKTICYDYEQCATAIEYWEGSTSEEAPRRSQEYRMLLAELEEEVRQILV